MEGEVSTVAQVERFEDYCLRKKGLEVDIEAALGRRDEKAVETIELAELELENTKRECADMMARVKVALQGNFERAEKFGVHPETRRNDMWIALEESVFPHTTNASGNTDASTGIDGQDRLKSVDRFEEDDSSDEFLTLLVQRYTDICHERRMLQEEIEDGLERKERLASERLRCANIMLETTRQKAIEIVAVLNEASAGETKISLPVGDIDTLSPKLTSIGVDGVLESGPRATGNSPQQNVHYRPPHLRGPGGLDSPQSSNSSQQSSNNGGTRGPAGTKPRFHGSQPMAPPPMSQQLKPPPANMQGMPRGMPSGAGVGAPRVLGQAPPPAFGQVPHWNGTQGIPPPMHWPPMPYPYVGSMSDKPALCSHSFTVLTRPPLRTQHTSTLLEGIARSYTAPYSRFGAPFHFPIIRHCLK